MFLLLFAFISLLLYFNTLIIEFHLNISNLAVITIQVPSGYQIAYSFIANCWFICIYVQRNRPTVFILFCGLDFIPNLHVFYFAYSFISLLHRQSIISILMFPSDQLNTDRDLQYWTLNVKMIWLQSWMQERLVSNKTLLPCFIGILKFCQ